MTGAPQPQGSGHSSCRELAAAGTATYGASGASGGDAFVLMQAAHVKTPSDCVHPARAPMQVWSHSVRHIPLCE